MDALTIESDHLPLVLKAADIQRLLRLSRVTTYELLAREDFPAIRVGRVIRVPRDAFLRWLENRGERCEA